MHRGIGTTNDLLQLEIRNEKLAINSENGGRVEDWQHGTAK